MRYQNYQQCIEDAASALMRAAGNGPWDRAELRLIWIDDDVWQDTAARIAVGKRDSIVVDAGSWITALPDLVSPGKGRFSKMSLDVDRDGRFEARYSFEAIPDNADELMALGKLPPNFWP